MLNISSAPVLSWHPKFRPYVLNNGITILNSEDFPLCFSEEDNPLNWLGKAKHNTEDQAKMFYRIDQLKQQGILVEGEDYTTNNYQLAPFEGVLRKISIHEQCKISVLSSLDNMVEGKVIGLLKNISGENFPANSVHFILTDDIFDQRLLNIIQQSDQDSSFFCILKLTGEKLLISPLLASYSVLLQMQKRLLHNQPVLRFLREQFSKEEHFVPFSKIEKLSDELELLFQQGIHEQLQQEKSELIIINTQDKTLERHPLVLSVVKDDNFEKQISAPIILEPCPVHFNIDGGSRSKTPKKTLATLEGFISPITGLITHIQEYKGSEGQEVKIFVSAFFKSPVHQDGLSGNDFVQICMGKGVSPVQSKVSALCETIERFSAVYQGNEPLYATKASALSQNYYSYDQLCTYSTSQYAAFLDPQNPDSKQKQAVIVYKDEEIQWFPTYSLSHKRQVLVPMSICFSNFPFKDTRFGCWNSNGCAAGNTLEEAILQGLFELIERDATAIWWYNQLERPGVDLKIIPEAHLQKLHATLSEEQEYHLLDLTTDLGIPVVVAVAKYKNHDGYSFGFGCHLQEEIAAQRALTELCQLLPIRNQKDAPFDFDAIQEGNYLHPQLGQATVPRLLQSSKDISEDVKGLVAVLKEKGYETLAFDCTRAPLPIHTAKVFVPRLCHIWPQLANKRLYALPVQMGWLEKAKVEKELNPQGLYL